MVVPAFALAEPMDTLGRRHSERMRLQGELLQNLQQLRRSAAYETRLSEADDAIVEILARSTSDDWGRLAHLYTRVATSCVLAPLGPEVVLKSLRFADTFDMDLPDAMVLAGVVEHLRADPADQASFVTKNSKDFDDPGIRDLLADHGCRFMTRFGPAVGFARGQ